MERETVKFLALLLLILSLAGGALSLAEEEGLYGPIPQNELEKATEFLESRLGPSLTREAVELVESGFYGTRQDFSGFWASYRFVPPSMPGAEVRFNLERVVGEDNWSCMTGVLPECGTFSEYCDLVVTADEALLQARESGFVDEGVEYRVILGIYPGVDCFAWQVTPKVKEGFCATGEPVFIVNARTGKVERDLRGKH